MAKISVLQAFAGIALLATPAAAQTAASPTPEHGRLSVCRAAIASYCQNVEAGRGRKLDCLIQNKAKLSSDCASVVDARAAARAARGGTAVAQGPGGPSEAMASSGGHRHGRLAVCRTDLASFCQDVERGGGRKVACLKENQAKLSSDCAGALSKLN
jgi:cysteine rich repeat protein